VPNPAGSIDRYERLLEVQTLMARVSREMGPALDLDRVLRTVLETLRELVPCDGGCISLTEGDAIVLAATHPHYDLPADGQDSSFARHVTATAKSIHARDLAVDETPEPLAAKRAYAYGIRSFLCVPLICMGQPIGALSVFASEPDLFDEEHLLLVEGLATQVAGTVENARRYRMITELEVLKSDFIARVSHELRTPITIMSGFLSTLLSNHDDLDHETRRGMLERVDVATSRLSGLIDQLLMLSRLEAGVVAATVEPVDAQAALDEVRRQSINPSKVEIVCPEGLRFVTDRSLLVRGLGFVVDNALKYAGSCRVVATEDAIEVIDHGPGIPPSQRSRVFERFTRATDDTSIAGMGIGLPIARTLIAAAGADLTIEDGEGGPGHEHGCRVVARWL
jgi:K+-sensing histidine kinase KdpD